MGAGRYGKGEARRCAVANSLLDFVISLVRDPDAAARYAANPAQSIADAHLTDVTSSDVNNLIPMVSDSLSMTTTAGTGAAAPVADHSNVWASGAAAAALDSFTPHLPASPVGVADQHGPASSVIRPAGASAAGRAASADHRLASAIGAAHGRRGGRSSQPITAGFLRTIWASGITPIPHPHPVGSRSPRLRHSRLSAGSLIAL